MREEFEGVTWTATDLSVTADNNFATGVLAYEVTERLRHLVTDDEGIPSWLKSDPHEDAGATRATTVPFAIDLDSNRRFIAYAPSQRIQAQRFRDYFGKMLDAAAKRAKLLPADWEIVPLQNRPQVMEWLKTHPDVSYFVRTVRLPNPAADSILSRDLRRMKDMLVREKEERYKPMHGATIRLQDPELVQELFEGLGEGDIEVQLHARNGDMISSKDAAEHRMVVDWGEDASLGIEIVLEELTEYIQHTEQEGTQT